jgi:hypothetical protein
LPELADAFEVMSEESFNHHVSDKKNDFATWVQDILHDNILSERLRGIKDRQKALQIVKQRMKETHEGQYSTSQISQASPLGYPYRIHRRPHNRLFWPLSASVV